MKPADPTPSGEESFSAFMQHALFDPHHGYYTRRIRTVGAHGDFSTSASASPLLGRAIAAWLIGQSGEMREVRTIIEVGGGTGALMEGVRKHIGWWRRGRFTFSLVEASPVLEQQQRERLGDAVRWFRDLTAALDAADGRAFIFHNELLDALPVTLVQWDAASAAWHEVWLVHHADGRTTETLKPLTFATRAGPEFSVLEQWTRRSPPLCQRQRCELHTGIAEWLAGWTPRWKEGAMLAIDYGDVFPRLYSRRPSGTLRAYLHHMRREGAEVYDNAGRQDITSDVNFSDVRHWCARSGMHDVHMESQAAFLRRLIPRRGFTGAAIERQLLDEEGAGGAFKCLSALMRR